MYVHNESKEEEKEGIFRKPGPNVDKWLQERSQIVLLGEHTQLTGLLIIEFIEEDSPFCLTRAIIKTMIGPYYTPLSLAPRDAPRRCAWMK